MRYNSTKPAQPHWEAETNRRLSLRAQLILGAGLLLSLVSLSAIIGYLSLRSLQSSIEITLVATNEIREASLSIQNTFLLARQNEKGLLNNWQTSSDGSQTGFGVPASVYVTANRNNLEQAREYLNKVESLVHASEDIHLQSLQAEIDTLRPLLDRYEENFTAIEEILRALSTLGNTDNAELRDQKEKLEAKLSLNSARSDELADQIDEVTGMIGVKSKAGLERAHTRLNQINRNANITLGLSAGLTILLGVIATAILARRILAPVYQLSQAAQQMGEGNLAVRVLPTGGAEFATLANTFNHMAHQLQATLDGLEQRVTERTSDLQRRSAQLRIAAEIANEISRAEINAPRGLSSLLDHAVHLIRDRFGYAHASIFLLSDDEEWAVLRAATWEKPSDVQLRLRVKESNSSIVMQAIKNGQPHFITDAGAEQEFWHTNVLPKARSELVLPLRSGLRVIGALDIQREQPGAFGQEDMIILQIVADQIAAAVQNARLLQELRDRLGELETLYGDQSQMAWRRLAQRGVHGYQYDRLEVTPIPVQVPPASNPLTASPAPLSLPITVRGQTIGHLEVWPENETWSEEQVNMLRAIVDRLSQAIDSAHLFEEIQERASRELMFNRITSRVRASTNIDVIMQTAVQELAESLHLSTAAIQMRSDFGGNSHE